VEACGCKAVLKRWDGSYHASGQIAFASVEFCVLHMAAPDLLASAEKLVLLGGYNKTASQIGDEVAILQNEAQAAIQKAKGEA